MTPAPKFLCSEAAQNIDLSCATLFSCLPCGAKQFQNKHGCQRPVINVTELKDSCQFTNSKSDLLPTVQLLTEQRLRKSLGTHQSSVQVFPQTDFCKILSSKQDSTSGSYSGVTIYTANELSITGFTEGLQTGNLKTVSDIVWRGRWTRCGTYCGPFQPYLFCDPVRKDGTVGTSPNTGECTQ